MEGNSRWNGKTKTGEVSAQWGGHEECPEEDHESTGELTLISKLQYPWLLTLALPLICMWLRAISNTGDHAGRRIHSNSSCHVTHTLATLVYSAVAPYLVWFLYFVTEESTSVWGWNILHHWTSIPCDLCFKILSPIPKYSDLGG